MNTAPKPLQTLIEQRIMTRKRAVTKIANRRCASIAFLTLSAALLAAVPDTPADTIYVSDFGNNVIRKFDSMTGADLGVFASTGLTGPEGLALDGAGNLFVANWGNNTIEKFTPGGIGSLFAADSALSGPEGLAFDGAGNLYVANWWGNTIVRFTPDGVGSVFATGLSYPAGLACDTAGNVYVANNVANNIKKFTPEGLASVFASYPSVNGPQGLAFDSRGNLYVANINSYSITKFTPEGAGSVFASRLSAPLSLAFDSAGNLYVVNESALVQSYNKIDKFAPDGTYLGVFARAGLNEPFFIAIQAPKPPTINCPAPLILECTDGGAVGTVEVGVTNSSGESVVVVWTVDGTPSQTNEVPSGGVLISTNVTLTRNFGLGLHFITVSASNGETSPATCSTTVQVQDTIPPQILNVSATPSVLWPPDHQMVPVTIDIKANDNCGPTASRIIGVTSDESSARTTRGTDWLITGDLTIDLRAERFGGGQGRTYIIVIECLDPSGNSSLSSVAVRVPHDESEGTRKGSPIIDTRARRRRPSPEP